MHKIWYLGLQKVPCLFQGVLIRGVPAVLFIEVPSFQGVLIRGITAVLFIEVSSFQGVLIRGVPVFRYIFHQWVCPAPPPFPLRLLTSGPEEQLVDAAHYQGTMEHFRLSQDTSMDTTSPDVTQVMTAAVAGGSHSRAGHRHSIVSYRTVD